MNAEQSLIESIEKCLISSQDVSEVANNLLEVDEPKFDELSNNAQILASYLAEFKFDWDNESYDGDSDEFASKAVDKFKQILAAIKAGNEYKKIFKAELAYSHLENGNYIYKMTSEAMSAKTVDEATKEKDEIRAKAPKSHPEDKSYVLEDVRVKVKIVDQSGKTVLEEKFLLN